MVLLGSRDECIEMCCATVVIIFVPGAYFAVLAFCTAITVSNYLSMGFKFKDTVLNMFSVGLKEIACDIHHMTSEKVQTDLHSWQIQQAA